METPTTPNVPLRCPQCGVDNAPNAVICAHCGQPLPVPQAQQQSQAPWPPPPQGQPAQQYPTAAPPPDNTLGGLIPFKNSAALTSYYLAIFALIPCLGLFLGIAAFVLGLRGLKFSKEHPEAKGSAHAWIGIILGGLCGFGNIIGLILIVLLPILSPHH
jgi:hypothetical protein